MSFDQVSRFYQATEFPALVGTLERQMLHAHLTTGASYTVPIADVQLTSSGGVRIDWESIPTTSDLATLEARIATFTGGSVSSAPIELNQFAASTTTSAAHQTKVDYTTPPLAAGTYQVLWVSTLRMLAVAANTGIEGKVVITRSDNVSVQQTDAWDLANGHAFNGGITFVVAAGQTIRVQLTFARLGASGTAEMSGARVTIDQLSAAA